VTSPGRPPDVSALTAAELERTRRELAASLALLRPGSPAQVPILAHLTAIDAEMAGRQPRAPGQRWHVSSVTPGAPAPSAPES
jgi:hypothetical protein